MKHNSSFLTAALLAVLTFSSATAFADDHRRSGPHGPQARSAAAPPARGPAGHYAVPRQHVAPAPTRPGIVSPQVVRPYVARPYAVRPYAVRPYVVRPYVTPRYYRPYVLSPFYSAPYLFRPHFSLGFGISLGYPVPFYAYPYAVPVYGYAAPPSPVIVGPGSTRYGGMSLEISPDNAAVYVDGAYAGVVRDFDGTRQPLTLVNGRHHIVIDAPGFEQWAFDVDIVSGQVLPYRGDLQPLQ